MQARTTKEVSVPFNSTTKVVAYVDPDAFSFLNAFYISISEEALSPEHESNLIQQIVATLLENGQIAKDSSPIYISRIIINNDGSYDILIIETDKCIRPLRGLRLIQPINAAINELAFNAGVEEQFHLKAIQSILGNYFSSFEAKQAQVTIASKPKLIKPAPKPELTVHEKPTFTVQDAEKIFPDVHKLRQLLSESIERFKKHKSDIEKRLAETQSARPRAKPVHSSKEVTAVHDQIGQEWQVLQAALAETHKAVTLEIKSCKSELKKVTEVALERGLVIAQKQARIKHAKELLLWALYNAAGVYYQELQRRYKDKELTAAIKECNRYFSRIAKIDDAGRMHPIGDTYVTYSDRSLSEIAILVDELIAHCDTKLLGGASIKIEKITEQLQQAAESHPNYRPSVFKLEDKKFSWNDDALKEEEQALAEFSASNTDFTKSLDAIKSAEHKESQLKDQARTSIATFQKRMAEKHKSLKRIAAAEKAAEAEKRISLELITAAEETMKEIRVVQELFAQLEALLHKHTYLNNIISTENLAQDIQSAKDQIDKLQEYAKHYADVKYKIINPDEHIRAMRAMRMDYFLKQGPLTTLIERCEQAIAEQKAKDEAEIAAANERREKELAAERERQAVEERKAREIAEARIREAASAEPEQERQRAESEISITPPPPPKPEPARSSEAAIKRKAPKEPGFFRRHMGKIIGGLTGFLAGAGPGAVIGAIFAPATFGLSIPVCAVIGGIIGAVVGGGAGVGIGAIVDSCANNACERKAAEERNLLLNEDNGRSSKTQRSGSTSQIGATIRLSLTSSSTNAQGQTPENSSNPNLDQVAKDLQDACEEIEQILPGLETAARQGDVDDALKSLNETGDQLIRLAQELDDSGRGLGLGGAYSK